MNDFTENFMKIRPYVSGDIKTISKLFYETLHSVNVRDYTQEQLDAWAKDDTVLAAHGDIFLNQYTLVVEYDGLILGFGSIDKNGYLDMLFTHKNWQNKGVATLLCNELERPFDTITTFSSVSAKPFFRNRGYDVLREQEVERRGITLKRYEMIKRK